MTLQGREHPAGFFTANAQILKAPTGRLWQVKDYRSDKITRLYSSLGFRKFTNTPTSIPETAR